MKLPGDGFNLRKLTKRQIAIGISLLALIITSVSVTALVIRPVGAATNLTKQPPKEHDDPRTAGKYFQLRHYGANFPAADAPAKAQAQARALPQYPTKRVSGGKIKSLAGTTTATWTAVGPAPEDYSTCTNPSFCTGPYGDNTGRVTALAVDPTDSNNLWVGTANGGVWHSTDGGANYAALSDSWQTLAIGAIAIDPSNHNTVYVGTGEANFNADGYWGVGIYKTTNGGSSWTQLGFSKFGGMSIGKIAVDPNNSSNILAAVDVNGGNSAFSTTPPGSTASWTTTGGIWESTDSGSNWTQVLADTSSAKLDFGTEVLFDPAHTGVAYAGLGDVLGFANGGGYTSQAGVYKSTDSGAHWTQLTSGIPTGTSIERVSLGLSQNGATLYAVLTDSVNFGDLLSSAVWVSTNANSVPASITFTAHSVPADMADASGGHQSWYDVYAMVDPNSVNTAYVGGVDIWQTTTGGASWTNLTDAYGSALAGVHPDQHALAFFSSSSSDYYAGNDGGMWKSVSGTFTNLNGGGLNITQFYGGSYGDVGGASGTLYGGAQDNGELQFTGTTFSGPTTWNQVFGGDGGYTAVDYTDNHVIYEEYVYGNMFKSTDGGANWTFVAGDINPNDNVNFIMPFVMSQSNHNTLFSGTDRVYATTNGASSWRALSNVALDTANAGGFGSEISALAVAPTNSAVVYAGDNAGKFFYTTNANAASPTWHSVTISGSTGGVLTSITVDPGASGTVYATFANFASGAGHHVFKSTNNGATWTDISAGLPNVPFESVLLTGASQKVLIAGSDVGIFASPDQGATWYTLGAGLPNVAIDQIFTSHDGTKLFVATHGRGMWELNTGALQVTPSAPITATVGVGSGGGAYSQTITVKNAGTASMNWSIADGSFPTCLSATPDSGTLAANGTQSVTISVNTAAPLTCAYNLQVTADGLIPSVTIPVAVEVSNLSNTWYFAEGYTGGSYTEWLTLANPGNASAHVSVKYLLTNAPPVTQVYTVNPKGRLSVRVNSAIPNRNVSAVVTSDVPIIAERPLYFNYTGYAGLTIPGGSDVLGATSLGTEYDFGYLDTTTNHDTWLTVLNNNSTTMQVTATYYPSGGGAPIVKLYDVAANGRGSIKVRNDLPAGAYSARVQLSQPGMVERPMYFKDGSTGRFGATDLVGVPTSTTAWYFAEGQADSTHAEKLVFANQGASTANVHVVAYGSNGSAPSFDYAVPAGQQMVISVNGLVGLAAQHGFTITSDQPILADRIISLHYVGPVGTGATKTIDGATDSAGAANLGQAFYFAEGYAGGNFGEYLELVNPSSSASATVTVSYLPTSGQAPTVRVYTIPAHSRLTVSTNGVMPNQSFSMQVLSDQGIVAERTMVFIYSAAPFPPGANVAVGYQP